MWSYTGTKKKTIRYCWQIIDSDNQWLIPGLKRHAGFISPSHFTINDKFVMKSDNDSESDNESDNDLPC